MSDEFTAEELAKIIEARKKLKKVIEEINEQYRQSLEYTNDLTSSQERQKETFENIRDIYSQVDKLKKDILDDDGKSKELNAEKLKDLEGYLAKTKQVLELRRALGDLTEEEYQAGLDKIEQQQKNVDLAKEEEQLAISMVEQSINLQFGQKTIFSQMEKINTISRLNLSNEERKEELLKLQKAAMDQFISKIYDMGKAMFDIALDFDKNIKNIMRSGTFSYEEGMRGVINTSLAMGGAAVPLDKLGAAMVSLKNNFTAYTSLTASERTKVEAMVAVLDKMGLSADASAKFLDTSTKSLGMSLTQSKNFLSSLKGFADQAGVSMQNISKDLAANASELAKFGKQGVQVFKELEMASKQLGIEMSKLIQVSEQFTTFEGAASAAAKFNALLGGDFINSVNLLNASMNDPIESFALFKDAMDRSGTSFEDMDNGMKRVMATAIGMSVEEAGKLFSQDINMATRAMREQAAEQEKLNKLSGEMTDFTDQLKTAFVALYPALIPVLESMKIVGEYIVAAATGIAEFVKENEGMITTLKVLGGIVFGVAGILMVVTGVLLPFASAWVSLKVLFGGTLGIIKFMFAPFKALAGILPAVGGGAAGAAPGVTALGGALTSAALGILALGAAIGLAAFGLSFLVDSFKGLGKEEGPAAVDAILGLSLAIGGMTLALILLGSAGAPGLVIMKGIALAAAGIGVAIGMAAAGMALYNQSQAELLKTGKDAIDSMNNLSDTTLEKYVKLVVVFKILADQMERISNTGVVEGLSSINFGNISIPSSTLEFSVGSTSENGNTSISQEKQEIVVNVNIDSPIQIDGRELGKYIATNQSVIEVTKKALNEARRNNA